MRARQRTPRPLHSQRGIAMLVAVLLVALGTVIAATVAYENAMTARRGAGTFAFETAVSIAGGAEALAGYGLRELLAKSGPSVYPGQGWDKPYGPLEVVPGVMLQATLEDLQGRFNVNMLVNTDGKPNAVQIQAFTKLLSEVGLEPKWAGYLVDWIDADDQPSNPDGAEDSVYMGQVPPYRAANRYITSTSELLALPGFGRERYLAIAPYIAALPPPTPLNVCTTPVDGKVLDAYLPPGVFQFSNRPVSSSGAAEAVATCPWNATDVTAVVNQYLSKTPGSGQPAPASGFPVGFFVQNSKYFRLSSLMTIGSTEFDLYSLLYFEQGKGVRVLQRSFTPD